MADVDVSATETAARQLLDSRVTAVRALAEARQARLDRQADLAAAEKAEARAHTEAQRAGWNVDELRKLGLEPARRSAGRPRRADTHRSTPSATSNTDTAASPAPDSAAAATAATRNGPPGA